MKTPETTETNAEPGTVVRRALGWLGSAYKRLSLSMILSVLLHAAVMVLVVVVLFHASAEEPLAEVREISVSLMSTDMIDSLFSDNLPEDNEAEPMPFEDDQPTIAETVEQQLRDQHDKETEALAKRIEQSAGQTARAEAEKRIREIEEQYRRNRDKRIEAVADLLDKSGEQVARLRQRANDVIGNIAKNEQRRRRWGRWTIWRSSWLGVEKAGGQLLVKDYPQPGQYTYIVNVETSPQRRLGPEPGSFLFVSITSAGLAHDIMKCREAGVALAPGKFIPLYVYPRDFEDKLLSLERKELNRRGISEERRIESTHFRLHTDGGVSLISISIQ